MISLKQAREIVLENILPLKETEHLVIHSCLGRICASDIKAREDIPPFDNSAMDGFAVKAKDTFGASKQNPKTFKVIEDVPAGYTAKKSIGDMQAIRIMTGAPLPRGADSVVMVEDTERVTGHRSPPRFGRGRQVTPTLRSGQAGHQEYVRIFKAVGKGENVRYAGEDVKKGEVVIKKGDILKSGYIGMLASLGISEIGVFRKPKVAILATGDELVEINQRLSPGKIRNSNAYSLYAQVLKTGAIPLLLGIARDKKKDLERKIRKGLGADMLLVSGGISVGDYDFVKDVLGELGTQMKFWRVAMRPGKPLAFGAIKKIPVFGLPGNPVSSMITFEQFVWPALLKMAGAREIFRFRLPAIFNENFEKRMGLRYFLRAVLENRNGTLYASLTGPQGSGVLKSMVKANGIIELPEDTTIVRAGETVQVTYLE
jgi:molybdopterin molybdotransferase